MQLEIEDFVAGAKERLHSWGAEERRQLRVQVEKGQLPTLHGWDSQTVAYTVMRHGGRAPMGAGMRKEQERPQVVETDAIVSRLVAGHAAGPYRPPETVRRGISTR